MTGVRVVPADVLTDALGEPNGHEPEPVPGSLLDRLRRRAVAVQRERRLELAVPGWHGDLVFRFRPLDVGGLERFIETRENHRVSGVSENIEVMAACCVAVLGRDGEHLTELADERGPVGLGWRLGALLGMANVNETFTVRQVVLALFGGNALALGAYVDKLVSWMTDPDANEAPGES